MFRPAVVFALVVFAWAVPLGAQNPSAPRLHGIDVQVVDREGEPIQGLTPDQFEVSLNGQPLPVAAATAITPGAPVAPGADTRVSSLIATLAGRQFILAIDATSFTEEEAVGVGAAAQMFVDRVSDGDRVGVFTFPAGPRVALTADRDSVRAALESLAAQPAPPNTGPLQRTIDGLAETLGGTANVSGRKIVVLITVATKHPDEAAEPDLREGFVALGKQSAEAGASIYALVAGHSYIDLTVPRKVPTGMAATPRADDDTVLESRLAGLVSVSGGALIKATNASPAPAVTRILTETASYYLLTAAERPGDAGVAMALSVRVKREGAIVRARAWHGSQARLNAGPVSTPAGVSVPAAPPPRRAPAPAPDSIPGAYARGEYAAVRDRIQQTPDLARWIRAVRDGGPVWSDAPRRDAMFALEIAAVALGTDDGPAIAEAVSLLAQQGGGLASREPDMFQCAWYWAGLTLFQSRGHAGAARPFIAQALARCPGEPRIILADAVIADQATPVLGPQIRSGADAAAEAALHDSVIERYRKARAFPETAAEAQVREAWLQFRVKRFDVALTLTETLPAFVMPAEAAAFEEDLNRQVRYIAHFVRGQVLREMRDVDRAADAFRDALNVWPSAQSASVALMTLMAVRGQRGEAERMAAAIEAAPESALDPWWWFWQGDAQLYSVLVGRLREMAR